MDRTLRTTSTVALPAATNAAVLAALAVAALHFGKALLVPLALAVLLSFVLNPLVAVLRKLRFPRGVAVGLVVALLVLTISILGTVMARQVTDLAGDLPRYEATLREKLKSLRSGVAQSSAIDKATSTLQKLSKELDQQPSVIAPAASTTGSLPRDQPKPIPVEIHQPPERTLDTYQRIMSTLLDPLTTTGIILIFVIFILLQREDIRDRVIRLVGAQDLELTTAALDDAASRLSRLFLAQTAINAGFGAIVALGLWAIGVPSPVLWGIVAALMRFIPFVGSVLAAVFPLLLAAAVDPGWTMLLLTLALYLVLEPIVGHVIEPMVQGQTTGLSPLAIVVSAVLWTGLWGPIGLLLATPLTVCLVVLGRHVKSLAFLDVVLGDAAPLTPAQVFYQRLLAGSSAEAEEQADQVLKSSSLIQYFDSVALPGLRLAASDAKRGATDSARMALVQASVNVLLADLSDRPLNSDQSVVANGSVGLTAIEPHQLAADWRGKNAAVLCLGVGSELDVAAADIAVQLFRQHGIAARSTPVTQLSELAALNLDGVKLVWLSSLDAAQANAQIRYTVRRLRRIAPQIEFFGGFWGGDPAVGKALAETAGLADFAVTFETAVRATIQRATAGAIVNDGRSVTASERNSSERSLHEMVQLHPAK
jgi:predicted PurR-regulated permease PerM